MSAASVLPFPGAVRLQRVIRKQLAPHFVECEVWARGYYAEPFSESVADFLCCRAFIKENGEPFIQARNTAMSPLQAEAVSFALDIARGWICEQLGLAKTMKLFERLPDDIKSKPSPNHRYGGDEV